MSKIEKLQIIKNIGSSWMALAVSVLVGVFLSPFILHRLGDAAFGIWVLIFSITGYYGLFDLGIRSSVVRYVSKAKANGDLAYASQVISTTLFSYTCIGAAALVVTVLLSVFVNRMFHVPQAMQLTVRWLLLMVGGAVSLGFPLGISGGVLEGLQEFSVLNWTSIVSTVLRGLLIVLALRHGFGLLMVAFITVILPLISSVIRTAIAWRLLPVKVGMQYVTRTTVREMAGYSGTMMIMIISARLRFKSDSIIIGTFLTPVAITYFNIGARIVDYAGEVVDSLAQIFVPMSSHAETLGQMDRLRKIFLVGNRFCAFTAFPLCALLIILGPSIIEVWVGARYVEQSYPVLLILLISNTLFLAQAASGRVLLGMSQHRTWAYVTLAEGVVNIVLSAALVLPFGIRGDALGTALPLAFTMIFFLPQHVSKKLNIPVLTFLREAYLLPLGACLPALIALLLLKRLYVPNTYLQLAFQIGVTGAVYGLTMAWVFASKRALRVRGELGDDTRVAVAGTDITGSLSQDI
jgi:O-antigen/teichoic acid export membrane protein